MPNEAALPDIKKIQFKAGSREAAIYLGQRHWTDNQGNVHWLDEEHNCAYCAGMRCPCTCESDCGSRPNGQLLSPYHCQRAEGYLAWLKSTGLYDEATLADLRERGMR